MTPPPSTQPLPTGFAEKMRGLLGTEADTFLTSLAEPAKVGLRVTTPKCSPEHFQTLSPWKLSAIPWCDSGFLVDDSADPATRPGLHPLHRAGIYYLQEPSAMAVAEAVAPRPGEWVIDLAAAPGGKATQLASLMRNQGLLVANEVTKNRVRALGENLERCGVRHALITSESVAQLAAQWGAVFDRVLLDAPCSGEGMFRKSDEARRQWSDVLVASCAARQAGLLAEAAQLVKPGGALVYSTCTFAPEENEAVIAAFLGEHPEFESLPLEFSTSRPGHPGWLAEAAARPAQLERTARFWPHLSPGEGHFVAKLGRAASQASGSQTRLKTLAPAPLPRQAKTLWEAFGQETLGDLPMPDAPLILRGDQLYAPPQALPDLTGLRTLRSGVWLGTLKKNRFEPAHSLALALTPTELAGAPSLNLAADSPELERYLQGDVLEAPGQDGWLVVTVLGFALGWGRRKRGTVKNFYPKGLRLAP